MPRGGARKGTPGTLYPNRSDLSSPTAHTLPVQVPTGQQYGKATQEKAALKQLPMATGPVGVGNAQPPAGLPTPAISSTPPPLQGSFPGTMPDLFRPTENPNEHFMTGVNAGPGQGSSALAPIPGTSNVADVILAALTTIPNPSAAVTQTKNFLAMQQQNAMPH